MRSLLLTTAALAACLPAAAFADEPAPTDLPEVVVTATRLPAVALDTPGAHVIEAEDIRRRGAVFAAEALADVPGLSVSRTGAYAGVSQVRMRGAAPGKTLVLIDGVPVNDASEINGAFDFSGFELAEVERIEVLSGPQSSLWGSDAIGGVIAFTTREIDGLRAEVEAGSFDTARGRLAVGRAGPDAALGAYVSAYRSDGISAADADDGNVERDGLRVLTAGAKGRRRFGAVTVDGALRASKSRGEIDGTPPPLYVPGDTDDVTKSEQVSGFVRASADLLGLTQAVSLSVQDLHRENDGDFASVFDAGRTVWRWQADGAARGVDFAFGAERDAAQGDLSTGASVDQTTTSAFGVARVDPVERLSLTGGLRIDRIDGYGSETTGRASAALRLGGGLTLSAAYGTGFKAPSISQAACDYCFSTTPYPTLRPETAESVEAALSWRAADGRAEGRVAAYRLDVVDQIAFVFDPVTFDSYYDNIDRARTDGVEVEGRVRLPAGFDLSAAYAWTDAVDQSTGARLSRVPEHSGSATLGWTGARLSGAIVARAEGDQVDFGGTREGFVTADLTAAWALTPAVELTGRVVNLADRRYQQVLGYGEPGRSAYVGVRLRY